MRDVDESALGGLREIERDLAVLLAEEDLEEVGAMLDPGSTAAMLVYENTWDAPLGSAIRRSGGELSGGRQDSDAGAVRRRKAEQQAAKEEV